MPEKLLQVLCSAGDNPGEYIEQRTYYLGFQAYKNYLASGDLTDLYRTETNVVFSCTPYEPFAIGQEVDRGCLPPGGGGAYGDLVVLRYAELFGGALVAADPTVAGSTQCPVNYTLSLSIVTITQPDAFNSFLGSIQVSGTTANNPITYIISGQTQPVQATAGSVVTFSNLPAGVYTIFGQDAAGGSANTGPIRLGTGVGAPPYWLLYSVFERQETDPQTGDVIRTYYSAEGWAYDRDGQATGTPRSVYFTTREVPESQYLAQQALPADTPLYSRDIRELVDSYFLPDGLTFREARHNGLGGLRFTDTVPQQESQRGQLRLLNIIKTDVDTAGTATGSLWAEAESPATPLAYALYPALASAGTPALQTSATGQFAELPAGSYAVRVTDAADQVVEEVVVIEDAHRPRWRLGYTHDGVTRETLLLQRGYTGAVEDVQGSGSPVVRGWAATGTDPSGILPEAIGSTLRFEVRTSTARQFQQVALADDRAFRVDHYCAGELQFRGYLPVVLYDESLVGRREFVTLEAADGLGGLRQTAYLNHLGLEMEGRRPLLATLLHCLSRTDTNLPLYCAVNLRDVAMPDDSDPLLQAWARRDAYYEAGKETDCRSVVEAILQPFNALLVQRGGAWWVVALNEVADTSYAVRGFAPNGEPLPGPDVPAPWHIRPAAAGPVPHRLHWQDRSQRVQVLPPTKALRVTVPLRLIDNQLTDGTFQKWKADGSTPLDWTNDGVDLLKRPGDKAGTSLLALSGNASLPTASFLSPAVEHRDGTDETPVLLTIKARVPKITNPLTPVATQPILRLRVQTLVDGVPAAEELVLEWEGGTKEVEQTAYLPLGLSGEQLRVSLNGPTVSNSYQHQNADSPLRLEILELKLTILPAQVQWPEQDYFVALNPLAAYTQAPDTELLHADQPRLPTETGLPAPVKAMDVFAWRHALSLADETATTAWIRPAAFEAKQPPLPLLENAALDRLELLARPGEVLVGTVFGPDVHLLGIGHMLDAVGADGKFLVVGCSHAERQGTADIAVRRLRGGSYTTPEQLPERVRITHLGPRVTPAGYRVA